MLSMKVCLNDKDSFCRILLKIVLVYSIKCSGWRNKVCNEQFHTPLVSDSFNAGLEGKYSVQPAFQVHSLG